MRNLFLLIIFIISFYCFAESSDSPHRFGLSIEGGYSDSTKDSRDTSKAKPYPENLKGNFGGTIFYQYDVGSLFAIRPEIGLYSYFFRLPINLDSPYTYKVNYATLNGRIGLGFGFYFYRNSNLTFNFILTPMVSMRFYDSADLYISSPPSDYSGNTNINSGKRYYFSGGISFSVGIETVKTKTVGFGGSFFFRFADKPTVLNDELVIIPSLGLSLLMYF